LPARQNPSRDPPRAPDFALAIRRFRARDPPIDFAHAIRRDPPISRARSADFPCAIRRFC